MSTEQLEELGPIDYVVFDWQGQQPDAGEIQPLLLELVDRGVVRILDIAFVAKDPDGSVSGVELGDLKQVAAAFAEFEGARFVAPEGIMPGLLRGVVAPPPSPARPPPSATASPAARPALAATGVLPYGQPEPAQQEPPPKYAAPPSAAPPPDPIQQLKDLAELKEQGVLTEEEFAAQKARILNT